MIKFNTCHNCDKFDLTERYGVYWSGVYPVIITELTNKEITLLQEKPIASMDFGYPGDGTFFFKILSSNKSIDKEELKIICDKFRKELKSDIDKKEWEKMREKNEVFKQKLKSVIVFRIGFAT